MTRHGGRQGGAAFCIAALATGCLLTTKLDGLSDDAPALNGDAAGGDATARDAASSDAARDPDAPTVAYCTRFPSATFCADFSEGMLPGRWDLLNTNGAGASAMLDSNLFASAPPSLAVTFLAPPTTSGARAYVRHLLPAGSSIAVGASFRIEKRGEGNQLDAFELDFADVQGETYALQIQVKPTGALQLWERIPNGTPHYNLKELARTVETGKWVRYEWNITVATSASSMSLSVDGVEAGSLPLQAEKFKGAPTLFAGDAYQEGLTSTWDVRYDDVLVNIQ